MNFGSAKPTFQNSKPKKEVPMAGTDEVRKVIDTGKGKDEGEPSRQVEYKMVKESDNRKKDGRFGAGGFGKDFRQGKAEKNWKNE